MVTCPWCGTSYGVFQSSCSKCGGPIHLPEVLDAAGETPLAPPSAPRPIADAYVYKLMGSDGGSIAALVFLLLGGIFTLVGGGLTVGIVTAFVGLPFLGLGLLFLAAGVGVMLWRYREKRKVVQVLKWGDATLGCVVDVRENYHLRVNGRHPWAISYQYTVNGQAFSGAVNTFNPPASRLQPGRPVYVLYAGDNPARSSPYPHP